MGFSETENKKNKTNIINDTDIKNKNKNNNNILLKKKTLDDYSDDEEYVGQDANIDNLLNRIDVNISLGKDNIAQPLLTPNGDNKIVKKELEDEQRNIKVPSCVYSKQSAQITTMASRYGYPTDYSTSTTPTTTTTTTTTSTVNNNNNNNNNTPTDGHDDPNVTPGGSSISDIDLS